MSSFDIAALKTAVASSLSGVSATIYTDRVQVTNTSELPVVLVQVGSGSGSVQGYDPISSQSNATVQLVVQATTVGAVDTLVKAVKDALFVDNSWIGAATFTGYDYGLTVDVDGDYDVVVGTISITIEFLETFDWS